MLLPQSPRPSHSQLLVRLFTCPDADARVSLLLLPGQLGLRLSSPFHWSSFVRAGAVPRAPSHLPCSEDFPLNGLVGPAPSLSPDILALFTSRYSLPKRIFVDCFLKAFLECLPRTLGISASPSSHFRPSQLPPTPPLVVSRQELPGLISHWHPGLLDCL